MSEWRSFESKDGWCRRGKTLGLACAPHVFRLFQKAHTFTPFFFFLRKPHPQHLTTPHRPPTSLPQPAPTYWTDVAASKSSTTPPPLFPFSGIQRRHRYPAQQLYFPSSSFYYLFLLSHWHGQSKQLRLQDVADPPSHLPTDRSDPRFGIWDLGFGGLLHHQHWHYWLWILDWSFGLMGFDGVDEGNGE